jgi:hypothetical protein
MLRVLFFLNTIVTVLPLLFWRLHGPRLFLFKFCGMCNAIGRADDNAATAAGADESTDVANQKPHIGRGHRHSQFYFQTAV